jgi:hypothetical protein
MMFFRFSDILPHDFNLRLTDGKSAVAVLPITQIVTDYFWRSFFHIRVNPPQGVLRM